ncbi:MAG: insulinase family protein [Tannerellaceae bacterium]|jgi:zinc protease|nr:insulinase family protein [Tannerellaceae bacterium]
MRTKKVSILCLWLLLCTTHLVAQQAVQLPVDPKVRYGKLDNGLTYYIRHNEMPKERADFYIAQNVGAVLEEENQRGLAHFLEHMAFNGSTHFPGNGITEYTESIGMRMGENLNAYTGFDETVYMLMDAPVAKEGVVDSCLLILHDWSGFLALTDSAIEKERKIIHEEWRTGQNATARMWEQQLPKICAGSRYANRMPIGSIDVIDHFNPEELRAYYRKWYRPDLQAIIVVGNVDVDQVEERIKTLFADIPAPVNPAVRELFPVPDNDEPLVSVATDREASRIALSLYYKHDKLSREERGTITGFLYHYIQNVTAMMINERFNEIIQKADPPFVYAGASDGNFLMAKTKGAWTAVAIAKDETIGKALDALVVEMERMKQYGFTSSEYERARANILKEYESAYNERENRKNSIYTREYTDHFTNGGYIPGIETEYTMISQIAPSIAVEQVNQYLKGIMGEKNVVISLTAPEKEGVAYPTEQELLERYTKALQTEVAPYEETLSGEALIPELPEPGKILETREDPLFGATVMTLGNGVKVVLKHTDFKKDEILMTATSPGGNSLFGDADISHLKVFNDVIRLGGLGNFSAVDLGKVLAGKKVQCTASLGMENEHMSGSTTPSDLKTLLELVYLNFTVPRMDEAAYSSYVSRLKAQLQNAALNPMFSFGDSITQTAYNRDPRAIRVQPEDLDRISYQRIIEMYKERFADASDFVFTFVGNLDKEEVRPLIEQYLATLPSLKRKEEANPENTPAIRKGQHVNRFNRQMETPKASVINLYSGTMDYTPENVITISFLKQVLDIVYTEKVREEQGGTYGVQTYAQIASFPKGQTILQIYFDTDPAKREGMNAIVRDELSRIVESGLRQEDFKKTKDNMLKRHAENLQENSYWLGVLNHYYYNDMDFHTQYLSTLEAITPEKVQAFAGQFLRQGNSVEVVMEP